MSLKYPGWGLRRLCKEVQGQAWFQSLTLGLEAGCGRHMLEVIHLCSVDDAVLKEHAGAIAAHHRGVGHFEDDSCIVHLTGFRKRLLTGRAFCESNMGRGFSFATSEPKQGRDLC